MNQVFRRIKKTLSNWMLEESTFIDEVQRQSVYLCSRAIFVQMNLLDKFGISYFFTIYTA